ncbi:MAG TPA: hypothetical protein VG105_20030 [Paraburkholderia sp.]|nr:hypothetical protein [Paraburkholderia sp.]
MMFPRSPIAGYMEIVPVNVTKKSAASPQTLRTHLIRSASDAAVVPFIVAVLRVRGKRKLTAHGPSFQRIPLANTGKNARPMALLYRMMIGHHKPWRAAISKSSGLRPAARAGARG